MRFSAFHLHGVGLKVNIKKNLPTKKSRFIKINNKYQADETTRKGCHRYHVSCQ